MNILCQFLNKTHISFKNSLQLILKKQENILINIRFRSCPLRTVSVFAILNKMETLKSRQHRRNFIC